MPVISSMLLALFLRATTHGQTILIMPIPTSDAVDVARIIARD